MTEGNRSIIETTVALYASCYYSNLSVAIEGNYAHLRANGQHVWSLYVPANYTVTLDWLLRLLEQTGKR